MATISILRSDLWPIGTTVSVYPAGAQRQGQPGTGGPPTAAAIASAAVDAAGLLTITSGSILSYTPYVCAAQVNGEWRYARCRSTADSFGSVIRGRRGDTTSWRQAVANRKTQDGIN